MNSRSLSVKLSKLKDPLGGISVELAAEFSETA
jgi:hypothetical protein